MEDIVDLFEPNLRAWLQGIGLAFLANHVNAIYVLGSALAVFGFKAFQWTYKYLEERRFTLDLLPFIDKTQVHEALRNYIPTNGQNLSPSNETEPAHTSAIAIRSKLIPFFLDNVFNDKQARRLYLVLADSGMGKSTFLLNLFVAYQRKWLRNKYSVKLIPLGHPNAEDEIKSVDSILQRKTILLLDALDEDVLAAEDYKSRLNSLVRATFRYKTVILTCRTQFFPSESEEPHATTLYKFSLDGRTYDYFKKIYLSPFNDKEVSQYIASKYPFWKFWRIRARKRAKNLILLCPYLMVRPMLLSYIDYIVEDTGTPINSSSEAYARLIKHWIEREGNRIAEERRVLFIENMNIFSKELAVNLFVNRMPRNGLYISSDEIMPFAKSYDIALDELELKGKSLLNRDAEGRFKFAHKSIFEYLIAKYAVENDSWAQSVSYFQGLKEFDQTLRFYSEMQIVTNTTIVDSIYDLNGMKYTVVRLRSKSNSVESYRVLDNQSNPLTDFCESSAQAVDEVKNRIGVVLFFRLEENEKISNIYATAKGAIYVCLSRGGTFNDFIIVTSRKIPKTDSQPSEADAVKYFGINHEFLDIVRFGGQ